MQIRIDLSALKVSAKNVECFLRREMNVFCFGVVRNESAKSESSESGKRTSSRVTEWCSLIHDAKL